MHLFQDLLRFVQQSFWQHEFVILFLLLLLEAAGIPLPAPGDTFVVLAGSHGLPFWGYELAVTASALLGTLIGSSLLFALMHHGGRPFMARFGKYVFLDKGRVQRMGIWFQQRGRLAIVAGWFIPGLRVPTLIVASLSGMVYLEYLIMVAITAVFWITLYFWFGALLAAQGPALLEGLQQLAQSYGYGLILGALLCGGLLVTLVLVKKGLMSIRRGKQST
jgi:membrane protein DedA with SNARE-associated domain